MSYEFKEYPKAVKGIIVQDAVQEEAVLKGTAILKRTEVATGATVEVVAVPAESRAKPKAKGKAKGKG